MAESSSQVAADESQMNPMDQADKNDKMRNAYLVFRALCKLSMKPVQDVSQDGKSQALRSKYLALHLIHSLLSDKSHVFKKHAKVRK